MQFFKVRAAAVEDGIQREPDESIIPPLAARAFEALDDRIKALESAPSPDGVLDSLAARVDAIAAEAKADSHSHSDAIEDLDRRMVQITLATAEGIERVDRAERRIRSTVKRARSELAEFGYQSDGLEAENAEIRLVDARGSEDEGVPPLRLDVGDAGAEFGEQQHPQPKGIPGHFSQEVLKALRG